MNPHDTLETEFITAEIRQTVAAYFAIPIVFALGGWLMFGVYHDNVREHYGQTAKPGSVAIAPSTTWETLEIEAVAGDTTLPANDRPATADKSQVATNASEVQASIQQSATSVSAKQTSQDSETNEIEKQPHPSPAPSSISHRSTSSSSGVTFPTYRFATVDNALKAARDQNGILVLQDQRTKVLMRLGRDLDESRISPTPYDAISRAPYSKRMVWLSKSDERVAAFIQAASALCDWDPTSADLFVVFPKSVDQQIQAEQNRTLSTRGLTPADDVDMVVTYLPSRLFNRFMVDVVLPAATVPSNLPTRSTSWEPTPIAEHLFAG